MSIQDPDETLPVMAFDPAKYRDEQVRRKAAEARVEELLSELTGTRANLATLAEQLSAAEADRDKWLADTERRVMQLAAIDTFIMDPKQLEGMHPDYDSPALREVRRFTERLAAAERERDEMDAALWDAREALDEANNFRASPVWQKVEALAAEVVAAAQPVVEPAPAPTGVPPRRITRAQWDARPKATGMTCRRCGEDKSGEGCFRVDTADEISVPVCRGCFEAFQDANAYELECSAVNCPVGVPHTHPAEPAPADGPLLPRCVDGAHFGELSSGKCECGKYPLAGPADGPPSPPAKCTCAIPEPYSFACPVHAVPRPTRDESVPPPGWHRVEDEFTAEMGPGAERYQADCDTLADAWAIYDREHGYAPGEHAECDEQGDSLMSTQKHVLPRLVLRTDGLFELRSRDDVQVFVYDDITAAGEGLLDEFCSEARISKSVAPRPTRDESGEAVAQAALRQLIDAVTRACDWGDGTRVANAIDAAEAYLAGNTAPGEHAAASAEPRCMYCDGNGTRYGSDVCAACEGTGTETDLHALLGELEATCRAWEGGRDEDPCQSIRELIGRFRKPGAPPEPSPTEEQK